MIFNGVPDSLVKECETKTKLSDLEACITFSLWGMKKRPKFVVLPYEYLKEFLFYRQSDFFNELLSENVECTIENEIVKKDNEWIGNLVPSLEKTLKNSYCQSNKKTMEKLNNTHYKFGQVKGIFSVNKDDHVMIELVKEVSEKE